MLPTTKSKGEAQSTPTTPLDYSHSLAYPPPHHHADSCKISGIECARGSCGTPPRCLGAGPPAPHLSPLDRLILAGADLGKRGTPLRGLRNHRLKPKPLCAPRNRNA